MAERLFVRLEGDHLHGPEAGTPPGTMVEVPPVARLRGHVSHLAAYREVVPGEVLERIVPDGAVRIIFNLGEAPSAGSRPGLRVEAAGASASPVVLKLRGRIEGVSVTLRRGAAAALLGMPAGEIAEAAVPLDDLWGGVAADLLDRLHATGDDAARIALVQEVLVRRLNGDGAVPAAAVSAVRMLADSGGQRSVRDVAAALGVGERRLQQLFQAEVGLSPRAFRRLARMHACLRALRRRPVPRWADVAVDVGFYDQSHLVNEFQALCGLSPSLFLERASGSSKTPG